MKQIEETSEYFTNLEGHYEFVEEKTRALQFACEKLLQEQVMDTRTRVTTLTSYCLFMNALESGYLMRFV